MTGYMAWVTADVLEDVLTERRRQFDKWGDQHHTAERWAAILGEEYGEACKEVCSHLESTASVPGHTHYVARLRAELVQVAAVAVAWVEDLDRHE